MQLHEIAWPGPGRLATMRHPPGGPELPAAMARLAEAGVQLLVSALDGDEIKELGLARQPGAAAAAGLELVRFPIADRGVPGAGVGRLADRLAAEVRADRFVVTHCWAGIGRSSLLAGATLVRLGVPPAEAWQLIRAARGLPVPDSRDQEAWLYAFAGHRPAPAKPD